MSISQRVVLRHIYKLNDAYQQLAEQLDFSSDFINNLDALYDELSGNLEGPIQITWENTMEAQAALGEEDYAALLAVFNDAIADRDDLSIILKP
ncbi:barnase inhibitor [Iodobacter sp. HSC-16F04]|uniref:Barnase inhibitor n=1 Tax=Iodobacter violaceini TaxID=3044271 RepID=A0ABX0L0Y1_9NEIS|nr:barstar family protein [Iodobacter violacea]NHQ88152.1 barnase inhibitor [Iodobacter violacea]